MLLAAACVSLLDISSSHLLVNLLITYPLWHIYLRFGPLYSVSLFAYIERRLFLLNF
jgi:hypothetical protein